MAKLYGGQDLVKVCGDATLILHVLSSKEREKEKNEMEQAGEKDLQEK